MSESWEYEPGTHVMAQNEPKQPSETVGFRLNHLMLRIRVFSHIPTFLSPMRAPAGLVFASACC